MLTDKLKKQNWPSYKSFLKEYLPDTYTVNICKAIYLDDRSFTDAHDTRIETLMSKNGFLQLLTSPSIDGGHLDQICEKELTSPKKRLSFFERMNRIQTNPLLYFGKNSFFGHNEELIYRRLNHGDESTLEYIVNRAAYRRKDTTNPNEYFKHGTAIPLYQCAHSVSDHFQTWREVFLWLQRIRACPDTEELVHDGEKYAAESIMLRSQWACEQPDLVDKNILSLCKTIKSAFDDLSMPASARAYYNGCIEDRMSHFTESELPGAKVTIFVRYDTSEQATAMATQLDMASRYPCSPDDDEARVHHLLFRKEGVGRPSGYLVNNLWSYGITFDSWDCVGNGGLLCSTRSRLSLRSTLHSLKAFHFNAEDLGKKYRSAKPIEPLVDEFDWFPVAAVLESMEGEWFVGNTFGGDRNFVPVDSKSKLKNIALDCTSTAEFSARLATKKGMKMLESFFGKRC